MGYRQFCQLFLFPLLLQVHKGVDFQPWLRGRVDGIESAEFNRLFGFFDRFKKGVLTHVYLQARLSASYGDTRRDMRKDLKKAGFNKELVKANARGLRNLVAKLNWNEQQSEWGDYTDQHNYSEDDHRRKEAFVEASAREAAASVVWDIGANTGQYGNMLREEGYQGSIYSFEPVDAVYKELSRRCGHDKNWHASMGKKPRPRGMDSWRRLSMSLARSNVRARSPRISNASASPAKPASIPENANGSATT